MILLPESLLSLKNIEKIPKIYSILTKNENDYGITGYSKQDL
jgi:hypothetical protein